MRFLFIDDLLSYVTEGIGIDLGTANTPVYVQKKGIRLREPSYVAINNDTGKVVAVGAEAKAMYGRTPSHIQVIRPLRDGVIANFEVAYEMIKNLLSRVCSPRDLIGPRVLVGVPSNVTQVERRAVREAALHAGARRAYLVEQPLAAAIGAGLPVLEPTGSMVVDIGGGTTEVAVIALGGIVRSFSLRVAGDEMDETILNYVKKSYNLLIGERTAEEIKTTIGSVLAAKEEKSITVRGRDLFTGLPKAQRITSGEIREALWEPVGAIVEAIHSTLEETPPELIGDIMERGIVLTGGGALLGGLDRLLSEATGVPVVMANDPMSCVALGTGVLLEDPSLLKSVVLMRDHKREDEGVS